jgi:hypothetical protein
MHVDFIRANYTDLGYISAMIQTLHGGCHCGMVRFKIEVPTAVTLLDCNCSICAMTGYLHLIVEAFSFQLERGADQLSEYRFNTGAAQHLFCATCGIKSFYVPRSHPGSYSVNWRALDDHQGVTATTIHYDGQQWETASAALND